MEMIKRDNKHKTIRESSHTKKYPHKTIRDDNSERIVFSRSILRSFGDE